MVAGLLWILQTLAACVGYQPAPIELGQSSAAFQARRLDDPALKARIEQLLPGESSTWPPEAWNRAQLLAVALLQNLDLAVTSVSIDAAQAAEITAGELANPDLTLQSEYARHDGHPWLYGLALDWSLTGHKQRRLKREIAIRDTINARLQLMEDTWTIRKQLIAGMTQLECARRSLVVLDEFASAQDQLIDMMRRRIAAGEEAPAEIIALQQARADSDAQRSQMRTQVALAEASTAKALGLAPEALVDVKLHWPDWGSPPSLGQQPWRAALERALLSRSDLAVAIGDYAIAESRLELAVSRQYPQVVIGPGYYWDHGIAKFPFNLGFSLPVNHNRGEIAQAGAARELAGQRMLALQADIIGAIEAAQRTEQIARENLTAAEDRLAIAKRQAARNELETRAGGIGRDALLVAHLDVLRSELGMLEARSHLQESRNGLEDALHAPLSGPELALAQPLGMKASGT
jgi:outer membrane protein TolC